MAHYNDNSWNFIIGSLEDILPNDLDLLFQLRENEQYEVLPKETTMWDILIRVGAFPNKSSCRGANFSREISNGFSEIKIGKKRNKIYIWKIIK